MTILGIAHMDYAQQLRHRLRTVGKQNEMDVIGHEAVAEYVDRVNSGVVLE